MWRCAIEQMLFFTLPNSRNANVMSGGGFFSGSKFRYSGRTEREILSEGISALKERLANSSPSKRKSNSVPATPSSPQGDLAEIRYSSLPRSTMSEPHGNCSLVSDIPMMNYATTAMDGSGVPLLLETVSEEIRNKSHEPSNELLTDYYTFRDSFEHSSSESGFTNLTDTRIGMKAPNGAGAENNHHSISNNATNSMMMTAQQQNAMNSAKKAMGARRLSLVHVFVPSFVLMLTCLFVVAIFIIESDSEALQRIKHWPEMVSLRYLYYEPAKNYLRELIGQLKSKTAA